MDWTRSFSGGPCADTPAAVIWTAGLLSEANWSMHVKQPRTRCSVDYPSVVPVSVQPWGVELRSICHRLIMTCGTV